MREMVSLDNLRASHADPERWLETSAFYVECRNIEDIKANLRRRGRFTRDTVDYDSDAWWLYW